MVHWHEVLPRRYGYVDRFSQSYAVRLAPPTFHRTLEIGAGLGEHLYYEPESIEGDREYVAVDLREEMVQALKSRHPKVTAIQGDCQERLDFPDDHFDRVLAIHVLEHLTDLPKAVREIYRLCSKKSGTLSVVLPCEGSFAYGIARRISAQRIFERRYKQSYRWFIEREHVSRPEEILKELAPYFEVVSRSFYPFPLPLYFCNLIVGFTLRPKIEVPS